MKDQFSNSEQSETERLEWIKTFEEINEIREQEKKDVKYRMLEKMQSNPFVPIGLVATTAALSMGLYSMRTGNKIRSQMMMRTRVACQGFTVMALLVGIVMAGNAKPKAT